MTGSVIPNDRPVSLSKWMKYVFLTKKNTLKMGKIRQEKSRATPLHPKSSVRTSKNDHTPIRTTHKHPQLTKHHSVTRSSFNPARDDTINVAHTI
jgi:hypothetical protein